MDNVKSSDFGPRFAGFLIPIIGFLVAGIRLATGRSGGVPVLVWSIVGVALWLFVFAAISEASH